LHLVGFFFMNCTMMHGSRNIKYSQNVYISYFNTRLDIQTVKTWYFTSFTSSTLAHKPL